MSSLYGLNKPNTDLKKNVFDLSEKTLFSLSAGMLLPCLSRELNPGEKVKISLSALTRTQPLNTAAFVRCRQYYHFFFVPFKQLWSGWDNFINGVDYRTSTLQSKNGYKRVPALDLYKSLASLIKSGYISEFLEKLNTMEVNPPGVETHRVLNRDEAAIWQARARDEHGIEYFYGISRLLDMLGYGQSLVNMFGEFSTLSGLIRGLSDGPRLYESVMANLDQLSNIGLKVNPFRLLAYQKIYSDFYKRDDYEATNPWAFNMDDLNGSGDIPISVPSRLLEMMRLRYRWQPKDYFTGVVPSELFGTGSVSKLIASDGFSLKFDSSKSASVANGSVANNHDVQVQSKNGSVSTKSIRAAFAIEKLLRLTRRAGGHDYISQTMAHYGFEPPKGRGDKVEFIGGFSNNINISEVLATADAGNRKLGDIGARGIGSMDDNKDFDYQAKEHGVLMCITSIVPESDYSAEGLNRATASNLSAILKALITR